MASIDNGYISPSEAAVTKVHSLGHSYSGDTQFALQVACPVCKIPTPSYKVLVAHFDAKHPKETVPPEESFKPL